MKNILLFAVILISSPAVFALPGDIDTTFGVSGGYFISDFAAQQRDERHRDSAIQADGKIVVVGRREVTVTFYDYLVARFNTDGTPDTTFNGTGFFTLPANLQNLAANAVAIQSDGKIVVAGGVGGAVFSQTATIFRLNSNGTLDTSFDTDGIQSVASSGESSAIVLQTDGKIVVATGYNGGLFPAAAGAVIVRLDANGSLDTTFDGDGRATVSPSLFYPNGLALQTDGKIIIAGQNNSGTVHGAVARLLTNGAFDTSFDGDGVVQTVVSTGNSVARSVAVQTDGKIMVGGGAVLTTLEDPFLTRYNSDGTLDTSFDGDGIQIVELAGNVTRSYFNDIVLQPNGKIIAISDSSTSIGNFVIDLDFFLARFNTDGSIDNSFDANGVVKSQWCEDGTELVLQADGKIVAIGSQDRSVGPAFTHGICVQRFNANGSVDTSVNSTPSNGKAILSMYGLTTVEAVASLPNGKIMVAGSGELGSMSIQSILIRLNANGTLDTTFMDEGVYEGEIQNVNSTSFYDLKVLSDGSFFVTGENPTFDGAIFKFTSAGVLDTTFSGDGIAYTGNVSRFYGIAIQTDGKIIGCGSSGTTTRSGKIARFSSTGVFEAFATNNLGSSGNNNEILKCGVQSDGKIVVGGYGFDGVSDSVRISRHLINLSIDTTFGTGGGTITDLSTTLNDRATDMIVQSDNKIVVSSMGFNTDRDFAVIRYDANGTLDPNYAESFGSGGISLIDFVLGSPNDEANALLIQPDGQILVGGSSNPGTGERFSLAKLNPSGALTVGWGTVGRTFTQFPNNDARINALSFHLTDGILAAGRTWNGTNYDFAVARYQNESIPTAATVSISGRVLTSSGYGISKAKVTLIEPDGTIRTGLTNAFGNYRFEDIGIGQNYILSVASKKYRFGNPIRAIFLIEELNDADFIAIDEETGK